MTVDYLTCLVSTGDNVSPVWCLQETLKPCLVFAGDNLRPILCLQETI